jgi:hypothetical protein
LGEKNACPTVDASSDYSVYFLKLNKEEGFLFIRSLMLSAVVFGFVNGFSLTIFLFS